MMAPRTIISGSIFTQSKPTLDQTLHELQTELHQARNKIRDLEYELSIARANVARLKQRNGEVIPHGDIDDGYECPNCAYSINDEMSYCQDAERTLIGVCMRPRVAMTAHMIESLTDDVTLQG